MLGLLTILLLSGWAFDHGSFDGGDFDLGAFDWTFAVTLDFTTFACIASLGPKSRDASLWYAIQTCSWSA